MTFFLIMVMHLFGIYKTEKVHDFHTSIAEITYNGSERSFEASIRVFSDDLEKVMAKENAGVKFETLSAEKKEVLLSKYFLKHFGIFLASGQKKAMNFVGHEKEADATWIYLEVPFKDKLEGGSFQNDVFFETFNDQTNILNMTYLTLKRSYLFKDKKGMMTVD